MTRLLSPWTCISTAAIDEIAMEHRKAVEQKIRDLRALKSELDHLIDQCRCGTVAECRIIESLSPATLAS
ncbi:hypothetical protein RAS12_24460 [Achromobacter seleniivolatilans]|uniref:Transcription regulator MerR DNA binding domain-containing protein n=1 Tax=Achromobacter seleniivolatilans TaxID=3047478 RepID=A0ABY9M0L1_9BURK|nr:MerR family DNA-binding protein [Achromobacter sp. R39]WMD19738.1 hypothetical protein RAS12_24460 [Achromobacter sp. R39]